MAIRQPVEIRELARTRVDYEGGRFLLDAILHLPGETRDRIVAWAVETNQPGVMEPQTTVQLIERLVRAEAARDPLADAATAGRRLLDSVYRQ